MGRLQRLQRLQRLRRLRLLLVVGILPRLLVYFRRLAKREPRRDQVPLPATAA